MSAYTETVSFAEAARRLGVLRQTVSDLVRVHKLPTHKIPVNGKARGLDEKTMQKLRRLLNQEAVSA